MKFTEKVYITIIFILLGIMIFHQIMFGNHNVLQDRPGNSGGVVYQTQDNLDYKFIKPLLDVGYANQEDSLNRFPLHRRIKSSVQEEIDKYPDVKVGFYFNDLSNAGWFGINEDEKFIPASLLKLPMLISYYKLRETELNLFDQQITYQGNDYNSSRNLDENNSIISGNTYTIKQLIDAMIIDSDNNALEMLYAYKQEALANIFEDLDAPLPKDRLSLAQSDFLSPKDMSKFFIVLYNASYLKKADSEEALELLSRVNYKEGLVKGVSSDVVVSHKYGERIIPLGNGENEYEFHDCGIVYLDNNPYKLCVMTKGKGLDLNKSAGIISNISKIVYEGIATGK